MKRKKVIQTLFFGLCLSFGMVGTVRADEDIASFNNSIEIQTQDMESQQENEVEREDADLLLNELSEKPIVGEPSEIADGWMDGYRYGKILLYK